MKTEGSSDQLEKIGQKLRAEELEEKLRIEAEQIVEEIRRLKTENRVFSLQRMEDFANRLGGNHPITTWMLDEIEAMGIDVASGILEEFRSKKLEGYRKKLTPRLGFKVTRSR